MSKQTGTRKCACGKTISANALNCQKCAPEARPTGGVLEILNVQGGDVKITFDKDNIAESIRARRIVSDMLRRGYALIVEVERNGKRAYERIQAFDETRGEYIVADLDSEVASESQILSLLIEANGRPVSRDLIEEVTGFKRSSRDAYLNRLGSRKLVEVSGRGEVRASKVLFT